MKKNQKIIPGEKFSLINQDDPPSPEINPPEIPDPSDPPPAKPAPEMPPLKEPEIIEPPKEHPPIEIPKTPLKPDKGNIFPIDPMV